MYQYINAANTVCVMLWLCRELLTYQQHYDWGLRALKTILKGCGSLLQINRKSLPEDGSYCSWIISTLVLGNIIVLGTVSISPCLRCNVAV